MITRGIQDEDQRKRSDAQLAHLQQQIDEMRRQMKEHAARDTRVDEYMKHLDGRINNLNGIFESYRQEDNQSDHVRRLEDTRVRKQVGEILERLDEPFKPIRQLQAQVQELSDLRRTDREQVGVEQRQYDALQRKVDQVSAHIGLGAEQWRQAQEAISRLHEVLEQYRRDSSQFGEAIRASEQRLRRQQIEFTQLVDEVRNQILPVASRTQLLEEQRKQDRADLEAIPPQIEAINQRVVVTAEEIQKLDKRGAGSHTELLERLEEIRQEMDAQLTSLHHLGDQRAERFLIQVQAVDDHIREVEVRLNALPPRIDDLFHRDEAIEASLLQVEENMLRRRLSQVQEELDDLRDRRAKPAK